MRIIFSILLLFLTVAAFAQESWTLNQCINYGLKNNLTQQSFDLSEKSARVDATQSKLNLLPSVSASVSAAMNFGRSVDPTTNDVTTTEYFENYNYISSSMTLFQGFIKLNRISYRKFLMQAAKLKRLYNQDDLAFEILTDYYNVIYYQGVVGISKEQLELSEFNLKKTEAQIETGIKAKTDMAEMQATYEQEKLSLIQSENKLEEAKLKLIQQMNLPGGKFVEVANEEEKPVAMPNLPSAADSLFVSFARKSPYVKMAEAQLNAASKSVSIARGSYFPSISLSASVSTGYYNSDKDERGNIVSMHDQFEKNKNQYIGATLSIPIFGKNEVRSEVKKAKLERDQAQIELDTYRQTVYYELMNNARELQSLYREYVQTQKQVEANDLAYQVAQRKYDEGLIDVIELLTVKSRLTESKSNLLSAELQWRIKDKIIDFYKGIRFWEEPETKDTPLKEKEREN